MSSDHRSIPFVTRNEASESATLGDVLAEAARARDQDVRGLLARSLYDQARVIALETVSVGQGLATRRDRRLDDILTSRLFGFPIMLAGLAAVFWLTVAGANYPSAGLASLFDAGMTRLNALFTALGAPEILRGMVVDGLYLGVAAVVSVMLPPMAIFFPLFTLVEDLGYLPRVAFNLDPVFRRAGGHGKQALTMAMGFGCNVAGVIAARIIDSPRERLLAILTNTFVPCNGRYGGMIAISALFFGALAAPVVVGLVLLGVVTTLAVTWALSKTLLRGVPSSFSMELPPYRRPLIGRVIVRSLFDRTFFVLARAVKVAAPGTLLVWLLANFPRGVPFDATYCGRLVSALDPVARVAGLDGTILLAFLFAFPAKEIFLPCVAVAYGLQTSLAAPGALVGFMSRNWSVLTAANVLLFYLLYFPCGTTVATIYSETKSARWTALSVLLPLALAYGVCVLIAQIAWFGF